MELFLRILFWTIVGVVGFGALFIWWCKRQVVKEQPKLNQRMHQLQIERSTRRMNLRTLRYRRGYLSLDSHSRRIELDINRKLLSLDIKVRTLRRQGAHETCLMCGSVGPDVISDTCRSCSNEIREHKTPWVGPHFTSSEIRTSLSNKYVRPKGCEHPVTLTEFVDHVPAYVWCPDCGWHEEQKTE